MAIRNEVLILTSQQIDDMVRTLDTVRGAKSRSGLLFKRAEVGISDNLVIEVVYHEKRDDFVVEL